MSRFHANNITADTITIGDLLGGDHYLRIPTYQRPYDWGKTEAVEMFEDLKSSKEGDYDQFFGTIVLDVSNSDSVEIIDGQQRITTFCLLLIALRTIANRNATKEDIRLASKINSVLNYDDKSSGRADSLISRLTPSVSILEAYITLVQDEEWDGFSYPKTKDKKELKRIKPILEFFLEQLSGIQHDEISQILARLYKGYVVVLNITDRTQALEIFEHANVRGMELNAADLLKSYFITNVKELSDTALEDRWIGIVSNTENVIRMIKHFGWTLFKKSKVANRKNYYSELKKFAVEEGGTKLLNIFDEFSQAYGLVEGGEIDDFMKWCEIKDAKPLAAEKKLITLVRSLRGIRLFRIAQAFPVIASALVRYRSEPTNANAKALLSLVDTIEKYHFINSHICQHRGNEVENMYADACRAFTSGNVDLPGQVNELKNKLKKQIAGFDEFKSKFSELEYEVKPAVLKPLYYLFDKLENKRRAGVEIEQIYNPRLALVRGDWEVEHIIAQNPEDSGSKLDEGVHSIGNLLVIPSQTNGTEGTGVSNLPVSQKVEIYREKIGRMTSVMSFCSAYSRGDFGAFETRDDILSRTDALARELYQDVFSIQ